MTFNDYLHSRSLTNLDAIAIVMGCWLLSLVVVVNVSPAKPAIPPDQTVIKIERGFPAWVDSFAPFQAWTSDAAHYGAFAVSEDGDYGWVNEYNYPDVAAQTAIAHCERHSETPCLLVARSAPAVEIDPSEVPMSVKTAQLYAENNARKGFRDFAIAEDGTWGAAWGYSTHMEARQVAMERCESYLRDRAADLPQVSCRLIEWRIRDIQIERRRLEDPS